MGWAAIIKLLLQAVAAIAKLAGDRQLIAAGQAQAVAEGMKDAIERFDRAMRAADIVDGANAGKPITRDEHEWLERVRARGRTGGGPQP